MSSEMKAFFVFVAGAIIGSFLNVCIYRLPRHKSIINPPSHCPYCKRNIPWYDNVPIISYIVLMGKCGKCRKRISLRYPFVEIAAGAMAVILYLTFGPGVRFAAYSALVSALIVSTFVDFEFGEIPDEITLGGLAAGLAASVAFPSIMGEAGRLAALKASAMGAAAGGGAILLMGVAGKLVFRKEAMGGGDVKLMAMIGSVLGWKLAILTFFIAPFFGAGVGMMVRASQGRETIPYGPYLSLAAVVSLFYGNDILRLVFGGM